VSDTPAAERTTRAPLPEGTLPVGAGLLIAGLASFAFFKLGQVALGKELFKPLMTLWFVAFTLVPGFFIPVEQELGRALAHRRALGQGGRPVVMRVLTLAGGLGGLLVVAVLASSVWLTEHMFEGHSIITLALLVTIVAYAVAHVARGISSGSALFPAYGLILGADSAIRIAACLVLWLAGVDTVGPYALTVALSPLAAVLIVAARRELTTQDGPPVLLADVTPNLGWLLVGSMMSAALVNAGPLGVDVLASASDAAKVTAFGNGVILARIPLFMFQAIQAALLPRLAKLAAEGDMAEFRAGFRRLMIVVASVAVLGTLGAYAVGPQVLEVMYDGGLDRRTLGLLAMSSGLFMLAQAVAQAVIALHGHKFVAISWLTGASLFVLVTAFVSDDLYLRVELGLVVSCAVTFVAFLVSLRARISAGAVPDAEALIDGVFDNPVEG
jgi:O-antigen/teichoic acid export membrane protein